jgi:rhodanese-related sulfurtransferase
MSAVELEPQEVSTRLEQGWQLVDVREVDERATVRIGSDRHIVMEELPQRADEIDPKQPVVFYCRTGNRSGMAAEAFRGSGYDAHNLAGGIEAWEAAGLPVERD